MSRGERLVIAASIAGALLGIGCGGDTFVLGSIAENNPDGAGPDGSNHPDPTVDSGQPDRTSPDAGTPDASPDGGSPQSCGGIAARKCAANEYCDFPDNQACGKGDALGVCRTRPVVGTPECRSISVCQPILCGCDRKTYCQPCEAHAAGTDYYLYDGGC